MRTLLSTGHHRWCTAKLTSSYHFLISHKHLPDLQKDTKNDDISVCSENLTLPSKIWLDVGWSFWMVKPEARWSCRCSCQRRAWRGRSALSWSSSADCNWTTWAQRRAEPADKNKKHQMRHILGRIERRKEISTFIKALIGILVYVFNALSCQNILLCCTSTGYELVFGRHCFVSSLPLTQTDSTEDAPTTSVDCSWFVKL